MSSPGSPWLVCVSKTRAFRLVSVSLRTSFFFFFNDTATTEIYTLSLHDALPISPIQAVGRALRSPDPSPDSQDGEQGDGVARGGAAGIGELGEQHAGEELAARQPLGVEAGGVRRVHAQRDPQLAGEPHQPAPGGPGSAAPARTPLLRYESDRGSDPGRQEQHHDCGQDRGEHGKAGHETPALEQGVDELERAAAFPARRASLVREPRKLDVRRRLGHQCVTMTTITVVSAPTTCARPASTVAASLFADMSRRGTTTTAPGSGVGLLEPKMRPRLWTARTLPFGCSTNVRDLSPRYDTPPAALR